MNGMLKNWPIISGAIIVAFGIGVMQSQINAMADDQEKHAKRDAHAWAIRTMTGLTAASARVDARTSLILQAQKDQRADARIQRQLIQRILQNQIR